MHTCYDRSWGYIMPSFERAWLIHLTLLPNDNISDQSKLKAFADDKLKVIKMAKFLLDKIENIVGKEENAGY